MNPIGIKSLSSRISELEDQLKQQSFKTPDKFEDYLIQRSQQNKDDYKRIELKKIRNHFLDGFESNNIDLQKLNLIKITEYAIRYIEQNIKKICLLIVDEVTSELKQEVAILLTNDLLNEIEQSYDIDFIKSTMNALCDLIFPKTNKTEEQEKFKVVKIDENFQFTKQKKSRFKIFNKK